MQTPGDASLLIYHHGCVTEAGLVVASEVLLAVAAISALWLGYFWAAEALVGLGAIVALAAVALFAVQDPRALPVPPRGAK